MSATRKQFYNVKYPFVDESTNGYMFDLATNPIERAKSEVMHLILTPKGQRIRKPDFGTNLIKFIFDMNDELSWEDVKAEIRDAAKKWLNGITIKNISVRRGEDNPTDVFVVTTFEVDLGYKTVSDTAIYKV
jgi:phage baseplate assembly protein W